MCGFHGALVVCVSAGLRRRMGMPFCRGALSSKSASPQLVARNLETCVFDHGRRMVHGHCIGLGAWTHDSTVNVIVFVIRF